MAFEDRLPSRRSVLAGVALSVISLPVLQNWSAEQALADATAPDAGTWVSTVKAKDLVANTFQSVKGYETKFVLARDGNKVYALSVVCTHKGGIVKASDPAEPAVLVCPKHKARYDITGAVVRKPATRNLPRYPLRLSSDGTVEVDTSRKLTDDDKDSTLILPDAK